MSLFHSKSKQEAHPTEMRDLIRLFKRRLTLRLLLFAGAVVALLVLSLFFPRMLTRSVTQLQKLRGDYRHLIKSNDAIALLASQQTRANELTGDLLKYTPTITEIPSKVFAGIRTQGAKHRITVDVRVATGEVITSSDGFSMMQLSLGAQGTLKNGLTFLQSLEDGVPAIKVKSIRIDGDGAPGSIYTFTADIFVYLTPQTP